MAAPLAYPLRPFSPLLDKQWDLISEFLKSHMPKRGRPPANLRSSLEGMRWVASTGKAWADMPAEFGNWQSVKRYYARLNEREVIGDLLSAFRKRRGDSAETGRERALAHWQLGCLQHLTERRPRGRAAPAKDR